MAQRIGVGPDGTNNSRCLTSRRSRLGVRGKVSLARGAASEVIHPFPITFMGEEMGNSGIALITSGVISSPVSFIDFDLDTKYSAFEFFYQGITTDSSGFRPFSFAVSSDGGDTFLNNSTSYIISGVYTTPQISSGTFVPGLVSNGSGVDSLGYIQTANSDFQTGRLVISRFILVSWERVRSSTMFYMDGREQ